MFSFNLGIIKGAPRSSHSGLPFQAWCSWTVVYSHGFDIANKHLMLRKRQITPLCQHFGTVADFCALNVFEFNYVNLQHFYGVSGLFGSKFLSSHQWTAVDSQSN